MTLTKFKSQLSLTFGKKMSTIGFKGSGFFYRMETHAFLFIFEIEVNEFRQYNVRFGIQPKAITRMGNFHEHNFKKLGAVECELSKQLIYSLKKPFWNISDNEAENAAAANEMFKMVQYQAMPVVREYVDSPNLFDNIKPADIDKPDILEGKFGGATPAGLPTRTAWMLAVYYEEKKPNLAKQFASKGLANNGKPTVEITEDIQKMIDEGCVSGSVFGGDPDDDSFFGMEDLRRIAAL